MHRLVRVIVSGRRARCAVRAVLAMLACAPACNDDLLGPGATTECDPLAGAAVRVTSEGLTSDGHYVVVLGEGPTARVFYGIPSHMVEGVIEKLTPGCALEIDFEVQGRAYVATFSPDPVRCAVASSLVSGKPEGPSTTTPLTVLEVAGEAADAGGSTGAPLMFYCL